MLVDPDIVPYSIDWEFLKTWWPIGMATIQALTSVFLLWYGSAKRVMATSLEIERNKRKEPCFFLEENSDKPEETNLTFVTFGPEFDSVGTEIRIEVEHYPYDLETYANLRGWIVDQRSNGFTLYKKTRWVIKYETIGDTEPIRIDFPFSYLKRVQLFSPKTEMTWTIPNQP